MICRVKTLLTGTEEVTEEDIEELIEEAFTDMDTDTDSLILIATDTDTTDIATDTTDLNRDTATVTGITTVLPDHTEAVIALATKEEETILTAVTTEATKSV